MALRIGTSGWHYPSGRGTWNGILKLYQKFTHPKLAGDRSAIRTSDVDQFKSGIEPLAAAERLGPLLAQFPARGLRGGLRHSFARLPPSRLL